LAPHPLSIHGSSVLKKSVVNTRAGAVRPTRQWHNCTYSY